MVIAGVSWRRALLTAAAVVAFGYFYVEGPLQERAAAFEFKPEMVGFGEPVGNRPSGTSRIASTRTPARCSAVMTSGPAEP